MSKLKRSLMPFCLHTWNNVDAISINNFNTTMYIQVFFSLFLWNLHMCIIADASWRFGCCCWRGVDCSRRSSFAAVQLVNLLQVRCTEAVPLTKLASAWANSLNGRITILKWKDTSIIFMFTRKGKHALNRGPFKYTFLELFWRSLKKVINPVSCIIWMALKHV